jgi:glycosyltransferase involved in cell wall biosynthesis
MDVMKKSVLITNIPNPYRVPLFNELSKQLKNDNIHLKIIFANKTYKRRLFQLNESDFQFDYTFLDNEAITVGNNNENTYFTYKGLYQQLKNENPDSIIVSGFSSATIKVFLYSLIKRTPYIIWNGSIAKKGRKDSFIRTLQRKLLTHFAKAFIAYGTKAKSYLMSIGATEEKVFIATNTVDTSFFETATNECRQSILNDGLNHFLYLGYLVPRKNVGLLIEIANELKQKRNDFCIDIIGDGESREQLELKVKNLDLCEFVKFHGFKQKNELPSYFANTKALLFQTDFDIWGLVLNEAMAAGVPCLSSANAGASSDLIQNGHNGFVVDYENKADIIEKINFIIENPEKAAEMGKRASEFMHANANVSVCAKGFVNAIKSIELDK